VESRCQTGVSHSYKCTSAVEQFRCILHIFTSCIENQQTTTWPT